jgi:hypothetical protein
MLIEIVLLKWFDMSCSVRAFIILHLLPAVDIMGMILVMVEGMSTLIDHTIYGTLKSLQERWECL